MKLKYFHDFAGDAHYQLPYVLVYDGLQHELMDVGIHCRIYCKADAYVAAEMQQLDHREFRQSFHFLNKQDAMFCKLRHAV